MKARARQLDNWGRKITRTAMVGIIICAGLYVYFLNDSVFNTARRQEQVETAAFLEATVATLESDYLAKLGLINWGYAQALGFVDSSNSTAYATLDRLVVSMNSLGDEI